MGATATIEQAGELLATATPPGSTVILFGSHARGAAGEDSGFDFLVIEPQVVARASEMVRLRNALDPLRISADVLVVSRDHVNEWGSVAGTVLHAALSEGLVLAGS